MLMAYGGTDYYNLVHTNFADTVYDYIYMFDKKNYIYIYIYIYKL